MSVINPPIELLLETEMVEKPKKAWILYTQAHPSAEWKIEGIIFSSDIAEKYRDGVVDKDGTGYWTVPAKIIV